MHVMNKNPCPSSNNTEEKKTMTMADGQSVCREALPLRRVASLPQPRESEIRCFSGRFRSVGHCPEISLIPTRLTSQSRVSSLIIISSMNCYFRTTNGFLCVYTPQNLESVSIVALQLTSSELGSVHQFLQGFQAIGKWQGNVNNSESRRVIEWAHLHSQVSPRKRGVLWTTQPC